MARLHKTAPELALESAMIVLSVLLALAASGWADARKQHQLTAQARASFVQEVRANRERVRRALPYHEALTRAVLRVDSAGGVPSYAEWKRRVPIWSGFAPPDVAATAWQSALATGALGNMPYGQVSALSSLYTVQGKLDAFTLAYLPLFDFSDPAMAGTVRRMNVYMQTVLSYEHALMREYDGALAALGAGQPGR
jgi:type II secretory pathway pseudopilin PulG